MHAAQYSAWHVVCSAGALVLAACAGAAVVAVTIGAKEADQPPHVWHAGGGERRGEVMQHALAIVQLLRGNDTHAEAPLTKADEAHLEPFLNMLDVELHRHIKTPPAAQPAVQQQETQQQQQQQQQQSSDGKLLQAILPVVAALAEQVGLKEHQTELQSIAKELHKINATVTRGVGPTLPELKMPDKFKHVRDSSGLPLWPEVFPKSLEAVFPGGSLPTGKDVLPFHWVITSCDRYQWGRMITHTLLTGLLNGLKPTTISVVWCKKYEEGKYPSLLRNLRHSHAINVFFPSDHLLREGSSLTSPEATYLTALMVPKALGMHTLPLLVTEDDVLVAPDANVRLSMAVNKIKGTVNDDPYIIQAYTAAGVGPAPTTADGIEQREDDLGNAGPSHDTSRSSTQFFINYGAQAYLFSPGMTALLLHEMLAFLLPGAQHPDHLQDMHVYTIIKDKYRCNADKSNCWYYTMYPSLVQHLGTSSSLFNKDDKGEDHKLNQRWHVAHDFPVRVSFPGYDPEGTWRRRARALLGRTSRALLGGSWWGPAHAEGEGAARRALRPAA